MRFLQGVKFFVKAFSASGRESYTPLDGVTAVPSGKYELNESLTSGVQMDGDADLEHTVAELCRGNTQARYSAWVAVFPCAVLLYPLLWFTVVALIPLSPPTQKPDMLWVAMMEVMALSTLCTPMSWTFTRVCCKLQVSPPSPVMAIAIMAPWSIVHTALMTMLCIVAFPLPMTPVIHTFTLALSSALLLPKILMCASPESFAASPEKAANVKRYGKCTGVVGLTSMFLIIYVALSAMPIKGSALSRCLILAMPGMPMLFTKIAAEKLIPNLTGHVVDGLLPDMVISTTYIYLKMEILTTTEGWILWYFIIFEILSTIFDVSSIVVFLRRHEHQVSGATINLANNKIRKEETRIQRSEFLGRELTPRDIALQENQEIREEQRRTEVQQSEEIEGKQQSTKLQQKEEHREDPRNNEVGMLEEDYVEVGITLVSLVCQSVIVLCVTPLRFLQILILMMLPNKKYTVGMGIRAYGHHEVMDWGKILALGQTTLVAWSIDFIIVVFIVVFFRRYMPKVSLFAALEFYVDKYGIALLGFLGFLIGPWTYLLTLLHAGMDLSGKFYQCIEPASSSMHVCPSHAINYFKHWN